MANSTDDKPMPASDFRLMSEAEKYGAYASAYRQAVAVSAERAIEPERLEELRQQYRNAGPSFAAAAAYINGLEYELRHLSATRTHIPAKRESIRTRVMKRSWGGEGYRSIEIEVFNFEIGEYVDVMITSLPDSTGAEGKLT